VCKLITYKPFYDTLYKKGVTEYELIFKHGISANTLHRMKKGEAITTKTMDTLCFILDCTVPEILEYEKPE
jgi:DNA-binding Xre family transcriptional regulator